jgi:hypothetical protein
LVAQSPCDEALAELRDTRCAEELWRLLVTGPVIAEVPPAAVIELARSLPTHDATAVITGAVDAADHLPHRHARRIVEVALGWGHKSARKAALERLCSWGDAERALELAAKDPDASLRRWATDRPAQRQPRLFD